MSSSMDHNNRSAWHECLCQECSNLIAVLAPDGKSRETESQTITCILEAAKTCKVPGELQDALARVMYDNRANADETLIRAESDAEKILGEMLACCLTDTDILIDAAVRLEDRWHAEIDLDVIQDRLTDDNGTLEDFCEKMGAVINDVAMHPESSVMDCERQQFAWLLEKWDQEADIEQVWMPNYGWDHFPVYDPRLRLLNALLPDCIDNYLGLAPPDSSAACGSADRGSLRSGKQGRAFCACPKSAGGLQ